jgi:cytochrome c553
MKTLLVTATALSIAAVLGVATVVQAADVPPPWAYGFLTPPPATPPRPPAGPPNPPAPPDNVTKLTIPESTLTFTRAQLANRFGPADWFPRDHGPMPDIVAHGRQAAEIFACSLCHLPNGMGRPENAGVAGLPYDYILQQLHDFREGHRKTSDPRKGNTGRMAGFAKAMTDDEMKAAATYFSSIKFTPWVKVVESTTVPRTRPQAGLFLALEGAQAGMEPIRDRIVEIPVNTHETEYLRNSRSGFVAYVPPGSLKKGENLVENGVTASGDKVTACIVCHGADLRGIGQAPPLAGRSPSYLARQLYDMQHGNRSGPWALLMAPVLGKLSDNDLLAASAYLASLTP